MMLKQRIKRESVRLHWLRICIFLLIHAYLVAGASGQTQERPNILFIFLDDFGWRDCGFMGTDFYETPHLDRLAAEGMVFDNAYAAAANCAPSRACLLSGQYTPRHQIYNVGTQLRGNPKFSKLKHIAGSDVLDTGIGTWAHCLRDAGYATGIIGKWHLSKDPLGYGFDVNVGGSHSGSPPRGYFPPHRGAPGLSDAPDEEYLTDRLTEEAIQFIGDHQQHPWMLYLSHFAVHTPLQARADLLQKYQEKTAGQLHNTAVMGAMIQSVDDGVGKIVSLLEQLELSDKTAIVFTSDNGGYGPATSMHPLKGYKGTYYEGGIREPFFVKWPGKVRPGSQCSVPITNLDLYPTFLAMAGAEATKGQPLDGQNLLPLLTGQGDFEERSLYWHFPAYLQSYARIDEQRDPLFRSRPCSIIRDGDWKLHEYFEDGGLELYNLSNDIGEQHDLSQSNRQKTAELRDKLSAWREAIGAPVPAERNPRYDPQAEAAQIAKVLRLKQ